MIALHARLAERWDANPMVVRVATGPARDASVRGGEAWIIRAGERAIPGGYRIYLVDWATGSGDEGGLGGARAVRLPLRLAYLSDGDILRVSARTGDVSVLYRRNSASNAMLLTERCNSNCFMCSQPPKDGDDDYLVDAYLQAIPLMSPDTSELGITGGEPTLLGDRFLEIVRACGQHLPATALHVLSNGRLFCYLSLCEELAQIGHPDLMVGVPLYADLPGVHDHVVQAKGAFDQTLRGLMNLKRCGVAVELRVVLHRLTIDRLPDLARFICRNLPFVDQVAFMGLEMMGYVKMNLDALWIDPADYQPQLREAVRRLLEGRLNVLIYNHQLCVLDPELWPYARKSISDWKREYFEPCGGCVVQDQCGGFFASAALRKSARIRALSGVASALGDKTGCLAVNT